jgi:hypothetical protein
VILFNSYTVLKRCICELKMNDKIFPVLTTEFGDHALCMSEILVLWKEVINGNKNCMNFMNVDEGLAE